MRIEKVHIENYRCIKEGEVLFSDITTFLGRNGVGKSTVLYALDSFYDVGATYTHLDYYNHKQIDTSIRIRVTYSDLRKDETEEFGGYVHGDRLIVTKIINQGGVRYFGAVAQIPEFSELRKMGARDKRSSLAQKVGAGDFSGFPEIPRRDVEVERVMDEYEALHPELTRPIERETQFFGPRNVGGGKLDKFTKFVLVPAVRDAASELEKRGAIMQLLDLIVMRSISNRKDFQDFKEQFEQKARELYGRENLPELGELGGMITDRLRRYAPGAELSIDFDELKPPALPLPEAVVTVSEDKFSVPVKYSGHGLQRALILALLEQLSLTSAAPIADDEDSQEQAKSPNLILAIEEPELYLHPGRSRYLSKILRDLAFHNEDGAGTQVVCVTHSPYFVGVEHFDEVRMCRKVGGEEDGDARITTFTSFARHQAAQRLAQVTGRREEEFTADTFVARASPVLNSIVNEGLFADITVVVEGDSDVAALWTVQNLLNKKWDELGIVVVPVSGKNNIDRAVVAFQGFGIPTYFMFDGDKPKEVTAPTNRILMGMGNAPVEDYPETGVFSDCAVFEDNIETYLKEIAGDRYVPLRDECAAHCGHERPGKAMKNSEVMATFLRCAHDEGIKFPVLHQIIETITLIATT